MKKQLQLITALSLSVGGASAFAQSTVEATHPCHPIAKQCGSAGYVYGDWNQGTGLFKDCVDVIANSNGATIPPPVVNSKTGVMGTAISALSANSTANLSACEAAIQTREAARANKKASR